MSRRVQLHRIKLIWDALRNISFIAPKPCRFIIYEDVNTDYVRPLLKDESVFVLAFPINQILLTPAIVGTAMLQFCRGNGLVNSYLLGLVRALNPDMVLTFIDNSHRYHALARSDHHNRRYLAIQNAARYDLLEDRGTRRLAFHSELACFGPNDKALHEQADSTVLKYYCVGSLREAYFRRFQQANNRPILPSEKQFDICVVAEASPGWDELFQGVELAIGRVAEFAVRLATEENLSIVIAGKRDKNPKEKRHHLQTVDSEALWYQRFIGNKVAITPRVRDQYSTYQLISQSRVSVATMSTALYEGGSRGARVLFCNFSGNRVWDFPGGGLNSLNVDDEEKMYALFKERVLMLSHMSDKEYQVNAQRSINRVMACNQDQDTIAQLEDIIFSLNHDN